MKRPGYFFFRLFSTVLIVAVPLVAIHLWTLYQSLEAARATAHQEIRSKSTLAAKTARSTLEDAQRLLGYVAAREEVRGFDPVACDGFLRGLEGIDGMYAVVSVLDLDGASVCTSLPRQASPPASAANSPWFVAALASDGAFLGRPAIGRISGRPVAPLSLPIRDAAGAKIGLAVVSVDLLKLEASMVDQWPAAEGILALMDRDGNFLVRSPDTAQWVGRHASPAVLAMGVGSPEEISQAVGVDGVERVFAASEVGKFNLRVAASIPAAAAFGAARSAVVKGLAIAVAAFLLAGALAYFGARSLARPVRSLARTAREFAGGSETARADESLAGEFSHLAVEMNVMHEARRQSERSARTAEARAQRVAGMYEAVSRTNQAIVRLKEAATLYETICQVCVETGQASMAWIGLINGGRLVPVAWGGAAKRYTEVLEPRLAAGMAPFRGPGAASVLDGRSHFANDYMNDPLTLPLREDAARFGIRASATVPFSRAGVVVGMLNLYGDEVGFFTDEVMRLLGEMATDISFALDNFERTASFQRTALELTRRENQLSGIVESATDAIVTMDAKDRIVVFNGAAALLFKVPVADALGERPDRFMPARFRASHARHIAAYNVRAAGQGLVAPKRELIGLASDGIEFPMEVTTFRTFDGDDALITMIIRDVTGERDAERARASAAKAEASNVAKTAFLSRMSHELRTPLNAVLAFSQLLQEEAKDKLSDVERHQLDLIFLAGAQLRALVDDVLDLSVVESGRLSLSLSDFELKGLLDGVLRMSEASAGAAAIRLVATYGGLPPLPMRSDPVRLRQVMLNLVSNAIKYNRAGGTATIGIDVLADGVSISVTDTGMGMSEQQLSGLFEPFNRLGRERGSIAGTGIGMALVRQLVGAMGGQTSVRSQVGSGTTVQVELPRPQRADTLLEGSEAPAPGAAAAPSPGAEPAGLVLYIEDNELNVLIVQNVMRRWPAVQLVVAVDGESGIEQAEVLRPDVILLDMGLPDMSGLQVLQTLQASEATRDLRVVVLSATAMAHDVGLARAAGAIDYWTKPIELKSFCAGMKDLLGHVARPPVAKQGTTAGMAAANDRPNRGNGAAT